MRKVRMLSANAIFATNKTKNVSVNRRSTAGLNDALMEPPPNVDPGPRFQRSNNHRPRVNRLPEDSVDQVQEMKHTLAHSYASQESAHDSVRVRISLRALPYTNTIPNLEPPDLISPEGSK